jgi:leucyl aminopeptidase
MEWMVKTQAPGKVKAPAVLVAVFEGTAPLEGGAEGIDEALGGTLKERLAGEGFKGKPRQVALLDSRGSIPSPWIAVFGLGKKREFHTDRVREGVAKALRSLREHGVASAAVSLDAGAVPAPREEIAEAAAEGAFLGLYRFERFKTKDEEPRKEWKRLVFLAAAEEKAEIEKAVERAEAVSKAVLFARDLVCTPANGMCPVDLAAAAADMAQGRPLEVTALDGKALEELGMNAFLSVAKGSDQPPRLIVAEYRGGGAKEKPVVLVGKGITFDSGGISLKPADRMHEMKGDMAGGAAVLAAVRAAADLGLPLNLVAVVPAAENLPGGRATRPGDVVKSCSGKTIEIINTDAEGRLLLADALTYAGKFGPAALIDAATLTGACVVALGPDVAGLFANDRDLAEKILRASKKTAETVWELPLHRDYGERLKSDVADMTNTGGREGGAITAALFLERFTGKVPWAHLDIAGPAFSTKDRPYVPKGGTGFAVRLLVEVLRSWKAAPETPGRDA